MPGATNEREVAGIDFDADGRVSALTDARNAPARAVDRRADAKKIIPLSVVHLSVLSVRPSVRPSVRSLLASSGPHSSAPECTARRRKNEKRKRKNGST